MRSGEKRSKQPQNNKAQAKASNGKTGSESRIQPKNHETLMLK